MSAVARPVAAGRTRVCPHCKAIVLESLGICPGCRHHLRFDVEAAQRQEAATRALEIEGQVCHPSGEDPYEYTIVVAVRNDDGQEIARKLVAVGALQGGERCSVTLSVEVLPTERPQVEEPAAVVPRPAEPEPAVAGRRLPDGTILTPPGLKPRR